MVNALTFTRNDGMTLECGVISDATNFGPVSDFYLIGINGHFSEYLDNLQLKTIAEPVVPLFPTRN